VPGYALHERLGAGGSSVVWRATRDADGAVVAVKVVVARGDADRAVRESALLRRLPDEGLVRVRDAFSLPEHPTAVALVLDFVEGGSLATVLRARGHLSAGEAVTVLAPVARSLASVHAAGVVHADVAPGNVLLERSGRPLLADLGVSRLAVEAPDEVFGTPGFVAPEVEAGQQPTAASDVYAVGALAWACVTGEPPAPLGLRRPLAELAPGLPSAWVEVVMECLSPLPAERPSAAEVALRLFDAAACEPLRLVAGGDEVSLITHRLRSAPPDDSGAVERAGGPSWRPQLVPRLHRPPGVFVRRGRPQGHSGLPGRRAGRIAAVALLLFVVGLAGTAWTAGRDGREEAGTGDPRPSGPVSESVGRRPAAADLAPAAGVALRSDPAAPTRRPVQLMQALADLRAAVLTSGDPARLGQLDAPGSPAWQADAELLRELSGRGERYEGLRFTVRWARPASAGRERATLRARVDTEPYRVTGPGTTGTARPAEPGEELLVHLRWSPGGWLVESVAPA
jgi:eukaryotic-like serine/threonine-protein kinase